MKIKLILKHLLENGQLDRPTPTIEQVAAMHHVPVEKIMHELKIGVPEEMKEHTTHEAVAQEIALDHLKEDPQYYSLKTL